MSYNCAASVTPLSAPRSIILSLTAMSFPDQPADDKVRLRGEVHRLIAPRDQKYQSNFVEVSWSSQVHGTS
jgi:hypothetical protein